MCSVLITYSMANIKFLPRIENFSRSNEDNCSNDIAQKRRTGWYYERLFGQQALLNWLKLSYTQRYLTFMKIFRGFQNGFHEVKSTETALFGFKDEIHQLHESNSCICGVCLDFTRVYLIIYNLPDQTFFVYQLVFISLFSS